MADKTEKLKNNSVSKQPVDKSTKTVDKSKPTKKKNGGARPGAGRPKGSMNAQTIEKMKVKAAIEERIAKHAHSLFNAQLSVAVGAQYLLRRDRITVKKNGKITYRWSKFERVEDPEEMIAYLDGDYDKDDAKYYLLTAEKPDVKAIDSLMDRSFGKAPQNLKITDDRPDPIERLLVGFGLLEEDGDSDAGQTTSAPSASS